MNDRQLTFIRHLINVGLWQDPGYDKFKITYRADGRIQVSWKYRNQNVLPPYPISDESGFMYVNQAEVKDMFGEVRQALAGRFIYV